MRAKLGHFGNKTLSGFNLLIAIAMTFSGLGLCGSTALAESKGSRADSAANPGIDPSAIEAGAKEVEELDRKNFERSENIDHAWWPLKPGMRWVYEGYNEEDGKRSPHRIVFIVTDLIKEISGVRSRVTFIADYRNGKLIEQELAFFAQDKVGNVWHLGEYVEIFEEDDFVGGQVWTIGNPEGAKAGIMMPADPKLGTPSYSEGYAPPPFNWTDRGRVYKTKQNLKTPVGRYDDVLVIEEFDSANPGVFQLKYCARGVGKVAVGWRGKNVVSREVLKLVKTGQLSPGELDEARAKALELEKRASMYPPSPAQRIAIAN